jgi:uncharacterized membrane protein
MNQRMRYFVLLLIFLSVIFIVAGLVLHTFTDEIIHHAVKQVRRSINSIEILMFYLYDIP